MTAEKTSAKVKIVTSQELGITESKPAAPEGFALWVRKLLQNWRQGTVGVKSRAEVARSTKKPWKQKGTGRARAGTARSPLWRGGGVIHGPQPRTRTLKMNKKLRTNVFRTLFAENAAAGNIMVADWSLAGDKPSTKQAHQFLQGADLLDKKVTLFIPHEDKITFASFINVPNIQILFLDQSNAFDLMSHKVWVVLEKDYDAFKEMVGQWH